MIYTTSGNSVPREVHKTGREQKYGNRWYKCQLVYIAHVFAAVTTFNGAFRARR
jgi:hypothetical protein